MIKFEAKKEDGKWNVSGQIHGPKDQISAEIAAMLQVMAEDDEFRSLWMQEVEDAIKEIRERLEKSIKKMMDGGENEQSNTDRKIN